jgi:protein transport protein SEC31
MRFHYFISNPYAGGARPGTAQVAPSKPPVSGTPNFEAVQLAAEHAPIKDGLLSATSSLAACPLTGTEKRQLSEAEKGIAILVKRLARGDIEANVANKIAQLTNALQKRDHSASAAIQKQLVNEDWQDHRDWLKGVKLLVSLGSRRLPTGAH